MAGRIQLHALLSGFAVAFTSIAIVRRDILLNEELICSRLALVQRRLSNQPTQQPTQSPSFQPEDDVEQEEELKISFAERVRAKAASQWNEMVLQSFRLANQYVIHTNSNK
jgi:hypothetical protein